MITLSRASEAATAAPVTTIAAAVEASDTAAPAPAGKDSAETPEAPAFYVNLDLKYVRCATLVHCTYRSAN